MGFHTLSIGTTAILTAQYGIDITGQNLGNIDTPGYSRQRVTQAANRAYSMGLSNAVVGSGVWVKAVKRVSNEYIEKQLRQATSRDTYYGNLKNCYTNIQSFFNEPATGNALSDTMQQFWGALEDFSTHVESLPDRATMVEVAKSMTTRFNDIGRSLKEYRQTMNEEVMQSISQINRLLKQVAELNRNIVNTELGGVTNLMANDLRDQRGEAIKELYGLMDIDVVEETNGSSIISLHGRTLVYFDQTFDVEVAYEKSDDMLVAIPVFSQDKYPLNPLDGQLAGQMEIRDVIVKSYKQNLDQLAANFTWEFNRAFSQTRGLETYNTLTSLNAPFDPSVTLDKLQYNDLIPPGTFQIVNGNFEIVIQNRNTNQEDVVNIEIDLDGRPGPGGEPDMILWDPANPGASNSLINRMQKALDEKVPGAFKVSIDQQNRVTIESLSADYGFTFGRDTSGVAAALGWNVLFTGHNSLTMGINSLMREHPEFVGGAYSFKKGDNQGALALIAVRDTKFGSNGGMSVDEYYQSITGRLGSEANRITNLKSMQEDILNRMFIQREELSGVNENEEMTKLITYQRAFQGASKFITIVDELYQTLINM